MNPVFSPTQVGYMRSRYSARDLVIFDPCTPVFRAKVASVPTGPTYLSIVYNTVSLGSFSAIKEGMSVIISTTADHTVPIYGIQEMRVAAAATASVLPINESAFVLSATYFITVLNTYKPMPRVRQGAYVDGRIAFQGQTATINNLPSAQIRISSTTGQFVLNPSIVTVDGSTLTSILYDIPGATYNVGSTIVLASTVTMPADSHTWARLSYTLSSGVTAWMVFQLIVIPTSGSTLPTQAIEGLRLQRGWDGHHATCKSYKNVTASQVMNGTRCVVVSLATLRAGDAGLSPIRFVGYLTKEANGTTVAPDTGEIVRYVQFDIASIWERVSQIALNPIAIRDSASPAAWDEINLPTTQRVINHILSRYSTVLNLCCLNLDDVGNTWFGGDMDVNSSSIGDAIGDVLSEIQAHITPQPSGELYLRRNLVHEDDATRNAATTIWEILPSDVSEINYTARHDEETGRIIIGVAGYFTNRSTPVVRKVTAPAVTLGTSPQTVTRGNQLLPSNKTLAELFGNPLLPLVPGLAQLRGGGILAAENPPYELSGTGRPSLSCLNPNCFQWINVSLPASTLTRGRAITGRHLLVSMEIEYDPIGPSHNVRFELLPETRGGSAISVVSLPPTNTAGYVVPPLPAYGGNYGGPSTLNVPDSTYRPIFGQGDMGGIGMPIPADQAYSESQYNPAPGCRGFAISFKNSVAVGAGFLTTLGSPYAISTSGSAMIDDGATTTLSSNFTIDAQGWDEALGGYAVYEPGVGFGRGGTNARIYITKGFAGTISGITLYFNEAMPAGGKLELYYAGSSTHTISGSNPTVSGLSITSGIQINLYDPALGNILPATFRLTRVDVATTTPSNPLYGDTFYQWNEKEDTGEPINIALKSGGLYINGAVAATPPLFNENHEYSFTKTGTGLAFEFVYSDSSYSNNQNVPLQIQICGTGAAT